MKKILGIIFEMNSYETLENNSTSRSVRFVADVVILTLTDSLHVLQEWRMWPKLNLLTALTAIIHPHWDQNLVGSLLKSCQDLLKLESKLLSKLPASCSWAAFFILALHSIFSVRNVCLSLGVLNSLNTSFVFSKLQISRLFRFQNPVCLARRWQLCHLS